MKFKDLISEKKVVREPKDIKVGDYIETKNDIEFNAEVTKVSGGKVYVIYDIDGDGDEEYGNTNIRNIKGNSKEGFYAPNHTF